ncbi:MAG: diacylglycerol/polyprenol kinase family protein [Candidatus Hodarchaeota archaeon]
MGYITLLPDLPIVWNLILGAIVAMIYIQGIIMLMERLVNSGTLSSDLSRKVIHIAAGSFIWIWLFIDTSDKFSYLFNIIVPLLFFVTFLMKGTRGSPDDKDVKTMTRTGDPRELLKGPLYFTIIMMVVGVFLFGTYAGAFTMAIVGWGDGIAPYIGKRWGSRKYKTLGREKTIEGSIGVFLFSVAGCLFFYILLGMLGGVLADPKVGIDMILIAIIICSLVAMLVEAISPSDVDNLLIPASTLVTLIVLDLLLPATFFILIIPFL